jgi:hypothetical protein
MKIKRKEARDEYNHVSRSYTRYLIWMCFAEFCYNYFGFEYLNDNDKYVKITKIYNEYLTLKKLNLKEKNIHLIINNIFIPLLINIYIYLIYILIYVVMSTLWF